MKRELSKDEKIKMGVKIGCGFLCVSLVAGYIYLEKNPTILYPDAKPYENTYVEYNDTSEEDFNRWLENHNTLSEKEKESIVSYELDESPIEDTKPIEETKEVLEEPNTEVVGDTIKVDTSNKVVSLKVNDTESTGYDKNGLPYLKNGKQYTFNEITGFPNEAPPQGKPTAIVNPTTGVEYHYINGFGSQEWMVSTIKEQEREGQLNLAKQVRLDGKSSGFVHMSDEDKKEIAENIARSFK